MSTLILIPQITAVGCLGRLGVLDQSTQLLFVAAESGNQDAWARIHEAVTRIDTAITNAGIYDEDGTIPYEPVARGEGLTYTPRQNNSLANSMYFWGEYGPEVIGSGALSVKEVNLLAEAALDDMNSELNAGNEQHLSWEDFYFDHNIYSWIGGKKSRFLAISECALELGARHLLGDPFVARSWAPILVLNSHTGGSPLAEVLSDFTAEGEMQKNFYREAMERIQKEDCPLYVAEAIAHKASILLSSPMVGCEGDAQKLADFMLAKYKFVRELYGDIKSSEATKDKLALLVCLDENLDLSFAVRRVDRYRRDFEELVAYARKKGVNDEDSIINAFASAINLRQAKMLVDPSARQNATREDLLFETSAPPVSKK